VRIIAKISNLQNPHLHVVCVYISLGENILKKQAAVNSTQLNKLTCIISSPRLKNNLRFIQLNMKRLFSIYLLLLSQTVFPTEMLYPFRSDMQKQLFDVITQETRCVVCKNQNLAESNAKLAKDLRKKIFELIQQGLSEKEIKNFLVSRYGDFILFNPPFKLITSFLWLTPFSFLLLILVFLFYSQVKNRSDQK
jgi:cytochrome c-type biogenesis protein CcmH